MGTANFEILLPFYTFVLLTSFLPPAFIHGISYDIPVSRNSAPNEKDLNIMFNYAEP